MNDRAGQPAQESDLIDVSELLDAYHQLKPDASVPEQHCAFDAIRLGHYIGDGAQPLHDSVNSDGWRGPNPHGYTTDRTVHGRFESKFVDGIGLGFGLGFALCAGLGAGSRHHIAP